MSTTAPIELLSRADAAERAGVHPNSIDYWVKRGWLRPYATVGVRTKLFLPVDVDATASFRAHVEAVAASSPTLGERLADDIEEAA